MSKFNILSLVSLDDQKLLATDLESSPFCVIQIKVYSDSSRPVETIRVAPSQAAGSSSIAAKVLNFIKGGRS